MSAACDEHPAGWDQARLLADCDVRRHRASGPGGQHRNKVETAVTILHRPTGVQTVASERRSQAKNHKAAIHRLRVKLALTVRWPRRVSAEGGYTPSGVWRTHLRLTGTPKNTGGTGGTGGAARGERGRIVVSQGHWDFPSVLAEAMDVLAVYGMDSAAAAASLGCSVSQLIKLLKIEPRALAQVNDHRRGLGLRALR